MKYLSVLVLMMSCWASYGGTRLVPRDVSFRQAEIVLENAEIALEAAESKEEIAAAKKAVRLAKAAYKALKKAIAKRNQANDALSEAAGHGLCAKCVGNAHSINVERDAYTADLVDLVLPDDGDDSSSVSSSSGSSGAR